MTTTDTHSACLPVELYRDIISYVPRKARKDLLSLSITSRALSYEAERVLYHTLSLRSGSRLSTTAFLELKRVHHHVHNLSCSAEDQEEADQLLMILRLVGNLKSLALSISGEYTCLPESPPFQLHTLEAGYPLDPHLKLFLQSQQQLTTLIWRDYNYIPSNCFSPTLKFVTCSCPNLISLQSRPISGLRLSPLESEDIPYFMQHIRPMTTVCSLVIFLRDFRDVKDLAELFPGVRFLECCFSSVQCPTNIKSFKHLEKIRVASGFNPKERVSGLFASHEHLSTIETWQGILPRSGTQVSRYTRGLDQPSHVPYDKDEWRKWDVIDTIRQYSGV